MLVFALQIGKSKKHDKQHGDFFHLNHAEDGNADRHPQEDLKRDGDGHKQRNHAGHLKKNTG